MALTPCNAPEQLDCSKSGFKNLLEIAGFNVELQSKDSAACDLSADIAHEHTAHINIHHAHVGVFHRQHHADQLPTILASEATQHF